MKKLLTYVGIIFLYPVSTFAQDTIVQNLPLQWTLEDCINYAKENNIQVNSLRLNERSGKRIYCNQKQQSCRQSQALYRRTW